MMSPNRYQRIAVGCLIAASWANVALLDTWANLFNPVQLSAIGGRPSKEAFAAAMIVVLLSATIGAFMVALFRPVPSRVRAVLGDGALLTALLILCATFWRMKGGRLTTIHGVLLALAPIDDIGLGLAALLAGFFLFRYWRPCMRAGEQFLLALSPFLAVTFGRATYTILTTDFGEINREIASRGIAAPVAGPRVIIIVFDELDYTFAFSERPSGVLLPTFDRLRSQSVFALDAVAPSNGTARSLPSYIVGHAIDTVAWRRPHSIGIRYRGLSAPVNINDESTIFHDAAIIGAASELVGSYLPYCRWFFASILERCTWIPFTWGGLFDGDIGIGASVVRQMMALAIIGNRSAHISRIQNLEQASLRAVLDPTRRLVFLHLPIPHFPPIWDTRQHRYTFTSVSLHSYFDNLALADAILGRIYAATRMGRTTRPTFFIVTSDHPWRSGRIDGRTGGKIPFLVRTPDMNHIEISSRVDAVRLRELTQQLLSRKLTTSADIATWLTARSEAK